MSNAINFEKMRKRRQRTTTLKRLLILVGVMLLIGAAIVANQLLVEEGFTTRLSDITASFGGSGFPADLPGGVIRGMGNIGENLTVLNDTSLYIFNTKGNIVRNIQKMTGQSVAITSPTRVLTFTPGSKSFAVHSMSRELYSSTFEFGIICGDMNERGDFAVVAPVKQFASKVYVYNRKFEEIYSWSSPEYVTNVSLSPKGDMMAINCLSAENGVLESLIYLFRFTEDKEKAEVAMRLPDNLCLDVDFIDENRVMVLTDKQYLCLNPLGEKKQGYDFAGRELVAAEPGARQTLLLFRERESKTLPLVELDASLKEKATKKLDAPVLDMAVGKDSVYILTGDGIDVYGLNLELKSRLRRKNISNLHATSSRLYYLTPDEIRVLTQSEMVGVAKEKTR